MTTYSTKEQFLEPKIDMPILVIDSGLGGVSILNALQKKLPNEKFIYFADYAYLPYGEKSELEIQNRCVEIVSSLQKENVKAVVLACNTATASAISYLRSHFHWEFFGTEPGIKPAAKESKLGIAVLATALTLQSAQFAKLLKQYANNAPVFALPAPELVTLVESGDFQSEKAKKVIDSVLNNIKGEYDTLLLGCTHFSFLTEQFNLKLGNQVRIIDTSDAIASRVKDKLGDRNLLQNDVSKTTHLSLNYTLPVSHEINPDQQDNIESKINLLKSSLSKGFEIDKTLEINELSKSN